MCELVEGGIRMEGDHEDRRGRWSCQSSCWGALRGGGRGRGGVGGRGEVRRGGAVNSAR